MTDVPLAGFTRTPFAHDRIERDVYRAGSGPAVIIVHEAPGLHPGVVAFARRVIEVGCTTFLPSLFGTPGRPLTAGYTLAASLRACVAREFAVFSTRRSSPITSWLRALGTTAHAECGGPGIGVVGMCFTGGFALGMMADPWLLAPVLSQPSLPIAVMPRQRPAVGVSPADLVAAKESGTCLLGLRFTADPLVPAERFATLRRELGDRFVAVEIDSSRGNPHGIPSNAHSVLTTHLVDEPGHPTRAALDQVLAHLREKLLVGGPRPAQNAS